MAASIRLPLPAPGRIKTACNDPYTDSDAPSALGNTSLSDLSMQTHVSPPTLRPHAQLLLGSPWYNTPTHALPMPLYMAVASGSACSSERVSTLRCFWMLHMRSCCISCGDQGAGVRGACAGACRRQMARVPLACIIFVSCQVHSAQVGSGVSWTDDRHASGPAGGVAYQYYGPRRKATTQRRTQPTMHPLLRESSSHARNS